MLVNLTGQPVQLLAEQPTGDVFGYVDGEEEGKYFFAFPELEPTGCAEVSSVAIGLSHIGLNSWQVPVMRWLYRYPNGLPLPTGEDFFIVHPEVIYAAREWHRALGDLFVLGPAVRDGGGLIIGNLGLAQLQV